MGRAGSPTVSGMKLGWASGLVAAAVALGACGSSSSDEPGAACAVGVAAIESGFGGEATVEDVRTYDLGPERPEVAVTDCKWTVTADGGAATSVAVAFGDYGTRRAAQEHLDDLLSPTADFPGEEIFVGNVPGVEALGTQVFVIGTHVVNVQAFVGDEERPASADELIPVVSALVASLGR